MSETNEIPPIQLKLPHKYILICEDNYVSLNTKPQMTSKFKRIEFLKKELLEKFIRIKYTYQIYSPNFYIYQILAYSFL